MKLNIAYPATGNQKVFEIEEDRQLHALYEKRISHEIDGGLIDDRFKGYVFRITGGCDKQGFPMMQGVLTTDRVRLLLGKGSSCFKRRRDGERKRKSVRGCIVSSELSTVSLIIVKKGDEELPGLTDNPKPQRLGPKRATRIRKLFNLSKNIKKKPEELKSPSDQKYIFGDDVRQYVIRREVTPKDGGKPYTKAPKIQRLITPLKLKRKRDYRANQRKASLKSASEEKHYHELIAKRQLEQKERREKILEEKREEKH